MMHAIYNIIMFFYDSLSLLKTLNILVYNKKHIVNHSKTHLKAKYYTLSNSDNLQILNKNLKKLNIIN